MGEVTIVVVSSNARDIRHGASIYNPTANVTLAIQRVQLLCSNDGTNEAGGDDRRRRSRHYPLELVNEGDLDAVGPELELEVIDDEMIAFAVVAVRVDGDSRLDEPGRLKIIKPPVDRCS